jgi:hypothetical protein
MPRVCNAVRLRAVTNTLGADDVTDKPALNVEGMGMSEYSDARGNLAPGKAFANGSPRRVGRRTTSAGVLGDLDASPQDRAAIVRAADKAGAFSSGGAIIG